MRFIKIYLLFIFVSATLFMNAQSRISVRLDTNKISIGDQFTLTLKAEVAKDETPHFPLIQDFLDENQKIAIIKESLADTTSSDIAGLRAFQKQFLLSIYEPGTFTIPALNVHLQKQGDTALIALLSDSLIIEVSAPQIDTLAEFRDIKGVMSGGYSWKEFIPYGIGLLVIAAIIIGIWLYRKREKIVELISKPKLPPHEIASQKLEQLRQKQLWQNDRVKEYYTELTDILREYIDGALQIQAIEMTSDELLEALDDSKIEQKAELTSFLRPMLRTADLVKFAKSNPLPDEHDSSFKAVEQFIQKTINHSPINIPVSE